jgi:hypothetical protein
MADKEEFSVNELTLENGAGGNSMLIVPEAAATQVATESTHTVSILINGTRYYIMLTTATP